MKKNILIVDPQSDGHHTTYVAHVAASLIKTGYTVYSFHSNNVAVKQYLVTSNVDIKQFNDCYIECISLFAEKNRSRLQLAFLQLKKWLLIRGVLSRLHKKNITIDNVFFLYIDLMYIPGIPVLLMNLLFPNSWSCLCFRPPHTNKHTAFKQIFGIYSIFRSLYCKGIGLLEEQLLDAIPSGLPERKCFFFPDFCDIAPPAPNYSLVTAILEKARGRRIIGTLGSQSKRKGLYQLCKVSEEMKQTDCFFVFAGIFSESQFTKVELDYIRTITTLSPDNCFFSFEFITDEAHFNALVDICDILTVLYSNFPYSSNIFSKAAAFRKLVIGSDYGCIGSRIEQFKFGITADCNSVQSICSALSQLCARYDETKNSALFNNYLQLHNNNSIDAILSNQLK